MAGTIKYIEIDTGLNTLHKWMFSDVSIYTTDFSDWHLFDKSRGIEKYNIPFGTLLVIIYEKELFNCWDWVMKDFVVSVGKKEAKHYRF